MVRNLMVRNLDSWPSPMLDVNSGTMAHFFQHSQDLRRAGLHLWFSACFQPCSTEIWSENHGTLMNIGWFWDILRHMKSHMLAPGLGFQGLVWLHWHRGSVWKKWTCGYSYLQLTRKSPWFDDVWRFQAGKLWGNQAIWVSRSLALF